MKKHVSIRKAQLNDSKFIYDLRFSDHVIKHSWNKYKPSFDEHEEFFARYFREYYIIVYCGVDEGFIRKEINGNVSIAIREMLCNTGMGAETLSRFYGHAELMFENSIGVGCFLSAGWKPIGWVYGREGY